MQVMEPICRELPRGSKVRLFSSAFLGVASLTPRSFLQILILSAHQSIGYLCIQLAAHLRPQRDLYIVAQCPSVMEADAQLCRDAGAASVLVDEPLAVLNGCHESEFDVVVDCVGGRRSEFVSRVAIRNGKLISLFANSLRRLSSRSSPLGRLHQHRLSSRRSILLHCRPRIFVEGVPPLAQAHLCQEGSQAALGTLHHLGDDRDEGRESEGGVGSCEGGG
jgi:NADPH:quinone reductase-like Zn-dependent oxidoreductase